MEKLQNRALVLSYEQKMEFLESSLNDFFRYGNLYDEYDEAGRLLFICYQFNWFANCITYLYDTDKSVRGNFPMIWEARDKEPDYLSNAWFYTDENAMIAVAVQVMTLEMEKLNTQKI